MRAAELDKQICVARPTATVTDYGSETATLTPMGSYRARLVYGRGHREVVAGEIVYTKSLYFTVRPYVPALVGDVVVCDGERYRVIALERRPRERELELTCEMIND